MKAQGFVGVKAANSSLQPTQESATLTRSEPEHLVRVFILAFLVCLAGCGGDDPSKNNGHVDPVDVGMDTSPDVVTTVGTPFKVGQFNVARFFDTVCQSGACSGDDYEAQLSEAEFNFKAQQVASAIDAMDVDAIALEEIEDQAVLDKLMATLQTPFTVSVLGETGAAGSLDVVVLSKGTWIETRKHRDMRLTRPDGSSTTFAREFLEVHTQQGGRRVVMFAAHFKAQRNDDPGRRFAEAQAAGQIMAATGAEFPEALVVLGGDLNDTPDSDAIQEMLKPSDLELLTEPGFWTYGNFETTQHIDHIVYVKNGAATVDAEGPIPFDDGSGSYGGSDHRALAATFLLAD